MTALFEFAAGRDLARSLVAAVRDRIRLRAGENQTSGDVDRYLCRVCGAIFDRREYECPECEGTMVVPMNRNTT